MVKVFPQHGWLLCEISIVMSQFYCQSWGPGHLTLIFYTQLILDPSCAVKSQPAM